MSEDAKAIQEAAKAADNAIGAARDTGKFIAKYIAGPLEQGMAIFEDKLRYARWERQIRLRARAEEFLKEMGLEAPSRAIPMKLAIPLIHAASLEEDDGIQDRWAALLTNAANADSNIEVQRAFISILEELSPLEAKILDEIYALPFDQSQHDGVITENLPQEARIATAEDNEKSSAPTTEVCIALSNLQRLGCLRMGMTWGNGEQPARINPTLLGSAFVKACSIRPQDKNIRTD